MKGVAAVTGQWTGGFGGHDFVRLWAATTVSYFGTTLTTVALPLVALVTLHASTFEVGLISTAGLVSWLLLGLSAGVWVDHLARRPLMVVCDLVRAAALVSVPIAVAAGVVSVAQLVVVALVIGVGSVFFDIAGQTYLPLVVEADGLLTGNSRLQAGQSAAQTGGPAAGGALAQLIGAPLTLLVDVASYLFSALCLATIRTREEPAAEAHRGRMLPRIREGLR